MFGKATPHCWQNVFSFMKRLNIMTTVEVATKLDQSPESKPSYPIWMEPGLLVGSFVCY